MKRLLFLVVFFLGVMPLSAAESEEAPSSELVQSLRDSFWLGSAFGAVGILLIFGINSSEKPCQTCQKLRERKCWNCNMPGEKPSDQAGCEQAAATVHSRGVPTAFVQAQFAQQPARTVQRDEGA